MQSGKRPQPEEDTDDVINKRPRASPNGLPLSSSEDVSINQTVPHASILSSTTTTDTTKNLLIKLLDLNELLHGQERKIVDVEDKVAALNAAIQSYGTSERFLYLKKEKEARLGVVRMETTSISRHILDLRQRRDELAGQLTKNSLASETNQLREILDALSERVTQLSRNPLPNTSMTSQQLFKLKKDLKAEILNNVARDFNLHLPDRIPTVTDGIEELLVNKIEAIVDARITLRAQSIFQNTTDHIKRFNEAFKNKVNDILDDIISIIENRENHAINDQVKQTVDPIREKVDILVKEFHQFKDHQKQQGTSDML